MSDIITDHIDFGESLLIEANREIELSPENAAYSARFASECFRLALDMPEYRKRAEHGMEEAARIISKAYEADPGGGIREAVERRFVAMNREADELERDSRSAVRAALKEHAQLH